MSESDRSCDTNFALHPRAMSVLYPPVAAGLLLAAIPVLNAHELPAPSATSVLQATGATKTTAYKLRARVEDLLPEIRQPAGRPAKPPPQLEVHAQLELTERVRNYLFEHPGCVSGSATRRIYSEGFHLFVLDLCQEAQRPIEHIARATGVPLGTLKDWMRGERPEVAAPANLTSAASSAPAHIQTVLEAYRGWSGGDFKSFCEHVQFHLRIPMSRQHISDLLHAEGMRTPGTRGRDADASANRGGFETFFPNAQWIGDGTELMVQIGEDTFKVNLEMLIDADSAAVVGASVRPTEDAQAVTETFDDGVATAGQPPLALLLDNKPSNHTDAVHQALGDTLLMRARPYQPTDKPHAEGTFGLFKQSCPPLVLRGGSPESLAMELARLVVTVWGRAVNHRPRNDRAGRSRAKLFADAEPTEEERAAARAALEERHRKAQKARETRARRMEPVVRKLLDQAISRLGLEDPDARLRIAIASWPVDAIVEGIAIFEGKKKAGSLPEGADARYLRGIVKNVAQEREAWQIAVALLEERRRARDLTVIHLQRQRDALDEEVDNFEDLVKSYVDKAMACQRRIDQTFWLLAVADTIQEASDQQLLKLAARRISGTYSVDHRQRLAAIRLLFAKALPID